MQKLETSIINPKPVLLFRKTHANKEEFEICSSLFYTCTHRSIIPSNSLVIGRYSVLPYYHELIQDLNTNQSQLINNLYEHEYIANMDYVYDIAEDTFPTWFRLEDIPFSLRKDCAFVLKGRTNSKKQQWNSKMYVASFEDAVKLSIELMQDSLISQQGLVIRKYIPLKTIQTVVNSLPITQEWRLFFYKENLLTYGYYWQELIDEEKMIHVNQVSFLQEGIGFAKKIAKIIAQQTNFFVIDIALTENNKWIVVEINDGQMSGLNGISANELYTNLNLCLNNPDLQDICYINRITGLMESALYNPLQNSSLPNDE